MATSCRQTELRTIPLAQFSQLLQTQTTVIIHNCTRTAALRFLPCPCAPHDLKTQEPCGQPPLPASPKDPATSLTSASKQPALSTWSSGNALGLGGNSAEILLFGTLADSGGESWRDQWTLSAWLSLRHRGLGRTGALQLRGGLPAPPCDVREPAISASHE